MTGGGDENRDGGVRGEGRLDAAAVLLRANEATPGPVPLPDFAALLARRTLRRRLWLGGGVAAALAGAAVVALGLRGDPLSYAVVGATVRGDAGGGATIDGPSAAARPPAQLLFSEGTEVGIETGATLRILERTARGAELAVVRGRAAFNVARRPRARWSVKAGPFTVMVTGTRFSVDWSPRDQHLVLDLAAGGVIVKGGAAEESGVAVRPGERLEAFARTGQLTIGPAPGAGGVASTTAATSSNTSANANRSTNAPTPTPTPTATATNGAVEVAMAVAPKKVVVGPARRLAMKAPAAAPKLDVEPDSDGAPEQWMLPDIGPVPAPSAMETKSRLRSPSAPAPIISAVLGGGGAACSSPGAGAGIQYRFEGPEMGISVAPYYMLSFTSPRPDRTHSWCGQGSLRVDATFDDVGTPNFFGRLPHETGQVVIRLPRSTDFTGRTLTMHFFVEGPSDLRLSALPVVIHRGAWVPGRMVENVVPDRWLTLTTRYERENVLPGGKTSPVFDCNRVVLILYNNGGRRTWSGAVYLDDVSWK